MLETRNAVIESAAITNDDHGLLSAWLSLDYGGSGQGFGGYALYLPKDFKHHDLSGPNFAGHFIGNYILGSRHEIDRWSLRIL